MKKQTILIFVGIILAGGVVYFSTHYLSSSYLKKGNQETGTKCQQTGQEHIVIIQDNQIRPSLITAKLCDKLTIINNDNHLRRIAFGEHDRHTAYNGVMEKVLQKNQSFTVTLNQPGNFLFHDHLQEKVQAHFSVID